MKGDFFLPAETFRSECRAFADGLLSAMATRIDDSLREEHERWRHELEAYFEEEYEPDIPWDEAEAALRTLFTRFG